MQSCGDGFTCLCCGGQPLHEFFEELALDNAPVEPRLWKRYVDDTCCIVKKDATEGLLDHLNSVRPSIQLTVEVEKDGMLPFLDTLLRKREDGSLDVTVYRKPTHTDRYLDFQSTTHPMSREVWSGACTTGHEPSSATRTNCRRKNTTFPRCSGRVATQVPSFTLPLGLLNVRRAPKTCHRREAAPLWWCCCTQQASVRTSGGCVGSMELR